ncbi:MAG TPA: RNA methyltransferase [Pyrinomonadaceae bacterium]|nr:RNA methyltransferase [Pyrinomonadaceae bacterium]
MHITSRDNSLLRQARAVRDGKVDEMIFVEGLRLCGEALRSKLELDAVIASEEVVRKEKGAAAFAELSRAASHVGTVSEKLLESISYTKTPQGIVVLAQRPEASEQRLAASLTTNSLLVVLHQLNNPVNVGAILRTAEAAGATGIITTRNTSDPFSPKSLRGAMGSAFRLPIWRNTDFGEAVAWCRKKKINMVGTAAGATMNHTDWDWKRASALVLGPESTGLSDEELQATDQTVSIPMQGEVESLNVSVAAGILLYEAARQRLS